MGRKRLLGIVLFAVALSGAIGVILWKRPPAAPVANSIEARGVTGDINWIIPASEIEAVKRAALAGSNDAAARLAGHYAERGQAADEKRWLTVAGNRGDCNAMSLLRERADREGDRPGAMNWNNQLRQHVCTWENTYGSGALQNATSADPMPLWNDY
jgi:hypothetical protein